MIGLMKDRSLIFDISIDQGGCFETSRPTRPSDPTYVVDGITHFCVPNLPSLVARTATYALENITQPFLMALAAGPQADVLRKESALRRGVSLYRGRITNTYAAHAHGQTPVPIEQLISG